MDKVKRFLSRGYFPVQLPDGFTTKSFAKAHKAIGKDWAAKKQPETRLEKFSVARTSYNRRITSIPNPIAYYHLVVEIAKYWKKLQKHYKKSDISLSRPTLKSTERAIKLTKFSDLDEKRVLSSAGFKYALVTDISRYFPTIYTHVIPWAIHGKESAKKNKNKKTSLYFGNIIDSKSMALQGGQTIGLPIGPDTSHVIAEVVGTAIDCDLRAAMGYWPNGYRYVDDYYLFFESRTDAEVALTQLTRIIANYELQIHPDKTRIVEVKELVTESWKYAVRKLDIRDDVVGQRGDIHRFFETLYSLEQRFGDESLIKYGLKVLSPQIVKQPNWDVMEAYLLKSGHAFPNALQTIVRIFETYHYHGYPINAKAVTRFCNTLIKQHSVADGHSEIAWTLWLALRLNIVIDEDSVSSIQDTSSSVCLILLLDMESQKLTKLKLGSAFLKQFADSESLCSKNWLLAYEAGRRFWLRNKNDDYISTHSHFRALLANDVYFYKQKTPVVPIFDFKEDLPTELQKDMLWASDDDIDEFFDFEEVNQDYSDIGPKVDIELSDISADEDDDEGFY